VERSKELAMDRTMDRKTNPSMNIAVFGDIHGRVLLAFELCARWQEVHGEPIAHILSVGDLGVYRSLLDMEKTSRRWAERDPSELGFSKFFWSFDLASQKLRRHSQTDAVLERVSADLLFVPGNHEEHGYLDLLWREFATAHDEPVAVDRDWLGLAAGHYGRVDSEADFAGYGRIRCLPQGATLALPGPADDETGLPSYELTLWALNGLDKYTPAHAWDATPRQRVDVLLSHETYRGRLAGERESHRDGFGSERLREVLELHGPRYHFFGHHHHYYPEQRLESCQGPQGPTRSVGMGQLIFDGPPLNGRHRGKRRQPRLKPGALGMLRVTPPATPASDNQACELSFSIVDEPWLDLAASELRHVL
jgi:hypothetical protein